MVRTVCSLVVMLAAGVAQSAPPATLYVTTSQPRVRFLSLAEARAIALENSHFGQPSLLYPGVGLDNRLAVPQGSPPVSFRVLAHTMPKAKGILVTGIDAGGSRNELERNVNQMLLNVEVAYWNLYGSYWQLYSREQALRFAYETWKIAGAKYKNGQIGLADFTHVRGQYELFRNQRLQALDTALDNDRQLRAMLGLPIDNGVRLVPSDAPTLVEKHPDWQAAWAVAMKRPELRMAREEVKAAELNLLVTKKVLAPALILCGVQDRKSEEECSGDNPFRTQMPYGTRSGSSCVRQAQLKLARTFLVLQDQELKAERFLGLYYRRMSSGYAQIKATRAQREAFTTQLRVRWDLYRVGNSGTGIGSQAATLNLLLEAQRFWADALAAEFQAITTYNNALAGWEYGKGTILAHAHVTLADEPPVGDTVRAVVYERKRTRSRVSREPGVLANSVLNVPAPLIANADTPTEKAPSLAALWKCFPPLRDAAPLPPSDCDAVREGGDGLKEWSVTDVFASHRGHAKQKP
jgi:hypothetical protein